MTGCPSAAAERYYADMDSPESCPMCGKDNAHPDGSPVFPDDYSFCSGGCRDAYMLQVRAEADALFQSLRADEQYVVDFNAACPLCAGDRRKLCRHQQGS